jgi:hypothetical protein
MVQITVPEDVGSDLRVLPEGTYKMQLKNFIAKMSQAGQPKLIARFVVQTEYEGKHPKGYISTVGETVLEDYSLQPQALFKLNSLYQQATKSKLPQGDFSHEEFCEAMNNALQGIEVQADLYTDTYTGEERTKVKELMVL